MPLDPQLDPVFDAAGQTYNVDPRLLKAVASRESGGNAKAVSPQGAQGLMQLMPETAKGLNVTDPNDPAQSIWGGAQYLAQGLDKYGDPVKALMYYHGGPDEREWGAKTQAYPALVAGAFAASPGPRMAMNSGALTGTDALAAVGQQPQGDAISALAQRIAGGNPPTPADMQQARVLAGMSQGAPPQAANPQVAQASGGMSDDDIINGYISGKLTMPSGAPALKPAPAQGATPSPGQPLVPTADPANALYPPAIRGALMGFPDGQKMLSQIIEEEKAGFQRNRDGSMSPIGGGPADPNVQYQGAVATKTGGQQQQGGLGGAPITPIPGSVESEAGKAGAVKGAQAEQEIQITRDGGIYKGGVYIGHAPKMTTVTDAQGNQYPAFTPPIGPVAPGVATPSLPGAAGSPANAPTGFPPPPPGAVMSSPEKMGPGQTEALREQGENIEKKAQSNVDMAENAQRNNALLTRMKADVGNFPQGPLGANNTRLQSYLRYFNSDYDQPVATAEEYNKNAGFVLRGAVHDTSSRAAVQEYNLIGKTLPSQETSPRGTTRVINEFQGLNDYLIAKNQAQGMWRQGHGNLQNFETDWQSRVSPDAFLLNRMTPEDRQSTITQLQATPEGRGTLKTLAGQMQYLKNSGLENSIQ
jgi:hypothetical protein